MHIVMMLACCSYLVNVQQYRKWSHQWVGDFQHSLLKCRNRQWCCASQSPSVSQRALEQLLQEQRGKQEL